MSIEGVEYRTDYFDDVESRLSHNALIEAEWQFSLDDWEKLEIMGAFRPYSAFLDGKMIANVSVADVVMTSGGRRTQAHQVGGVVVAPEYRGIGLIRELFEIVFDSLPRDALYFLYAHNKVYTFYERFGFRPAAESQFTAEVARSERSSHAGSVRSLDIWDARDRELLQERVVGRSSVSDVLAINGHFPLFLFNVLFNDDICAVRDHIYFIEPIDAIVLCHHDDGRFRLIDVIADRMPALSDLMPYFPSSDSLVEFRFTPDKMAVDARDMYFVNGKSWLLDRQRLYIRGSFPLNTGEYPNRGDSFFYPEMFLF